MKNKIKGLVLFIVVFFIGFGLCLFFNDHTRQLDNHSLLPDDLNEHLYSLNNIDHIDNGYSVSLTSSTDQSVTILIDRASPFKLYVNEQLTIDYTDTSTFSRILSQTIDFKANQTINIKFVNNTNKTYTTSLDKLGRWEPVILIGEESLVEEASNISFGMNMLYCGILLFISLNALYLLSQKKSEKYLLIVAVISFVELIKTALSANYQYIPLSDQFVEWLLPTVYLSSSFLLVYICYYLLKEYLPNKLQPYLKPLPIATSLTIIVLVQGFISIDITSTLIDILTIICISMLVYCYRPKRYDCLLIMIGYAIIQATLMYNNLVFYKHYFTIGAVIVLFLVWQVGTIIYIICCSFVVNNKFARKFIEAENLVTNLDQLVVQRTKELEDEQTNRRNIMSNIFHDLRSPIFILQAYLEKNDLEHVDVMKSRVNQLHRLTEDLFTNAKLESNELSFEFDRLSLEYLLNNIFESEKLLAKQKNIQLALNIVQDYTVWADFTRLQQAIDNIVYNAINYSKENSEVIIDLKANNEWIQIHIIDNGKGIPEEDIPFIFNRYYRSNFSKNKESSGLGLAIANDIIIKHLGKIDVVSQINVGTTFIINLPYLPEY